jgi:hypothetical protein
VTVCKLCDDEGFLCVLCDHAPTECDCEIYESDEEDAELADVEIRRCSCNPHARRKKE